MEEKIKSVESLAHNPVIMNPSTSLEDKLNILGEDKNYQQHCEFGYASLDGNLTLSDWSTLDISIYDFFTSAKNKKIIYFRANLASNKRFSFNCNYQFQL